MKIIAEFEVNKYGDKEKLVKGIFELDELALVILKKLEIKPFES